MDTAKAFVRHFAPVLIMAMAAFSAEGQTGLPDFLEYKAPVFPPQLSVADVKEGYAVVAFTVQDDGHVDDAVILAASQPLFGEALLKTMQTWQLAAVDSSTVPRREVLHATFQREGTVTTLSHFDAEKALFTPVDGSGSTTTLLWEQLATPPEKVSARAPAYPAELRARHVSGKAAVNFVIDTSGKVRVPVVVDTDAPEFGAAALEAVKEWRFTPPQQDGHPVLVEATRVFRFGTPAAK